MKRELTCIVCPLGCCITAEVSGTEVTGVEGNNCPRGEAYARSECISPVRTITTTVRAKSGEMVPVKTEKPIPKDKVTEAVKIINKCHPVLPIHIGDVIIEDVYGSRVTATANRG